jgi:hypothetical protein
VPLAAGIPGQATHTADIATELHTNPTALARVARELAVPLRGRGGGSHAAALTPAIRDLPDWIRPAFQGQLPTNRYPDAAADWIPNMRGQLEAIRLWKAQPDVAAWLETSRLNIVRGMFRKAGEPRMAEAITRLLTHTDRAVANLEQLGAAGA